MVNESNIPDLSTLVGEKAVTPQLLNRTVLEPHEHTSPQPGSLDSSLLWFVATAADDMEPWGRNTKTRDRQLRDFITEESMFSSALGTVVSRNQGFSWYIEGATRTAARARAILEDANLGAGWLELIAKVSMDLYTQDHGAFIEIVRQGEGFDSPFIGLNHLDAARCWHTGDPLRPVVYQDRKNVYHLLNWWEVITLREIPTANENLPGMQLCAETRLLITAQITRNIAIYKKEKSAGRHARAVHFVQGFTSDQLQSALNGMQLRADQMGLMRYIEPLLIGSHDPKAQIDVKTLELAGLPDGYDEKLAYDHYIGHMAMAFLSDYQDFAPLPGGGLGTSNQSEILHMKSRGKGPALFQKLIVHALNTRALPDNVEFGFEEQDLDAELIQAQVANQRATERSVRIISQELTPAEARQLAADAGDLPQEMLEAGAPDVTPTRRIDDEQQTEGTPEGTVEEEGTKDVKPHWLERRWYDD